mgnify:FL=1
MKFNKLGKSDLEVSSYCLGSMTWGEATSEKDGHWQLDFSIENGINFVDTAEMYPTNPLRKETAGNTEKIIGNWINKRKKRDDIIIATKVVGIGNKTVRNGQPINKKTMEEALNNSLKKLNTDYIDLYQLHWPNRGSYHFRQNWNYSPIHQETKKIKQDIFDLLDFLSNKVKEGKIRTIGLSNETAWGTMQFLKIADENNFERVVSIQNEYSLLCRFYDTDLAEVSHNENISLLAYSPLAAGLLTGKYQEGKVPDNSRLKASPGLMGRFNKRSLLAVQNYLNVAKKYEINPIHLALAYCDQKPFMGSIIFGATTKEQLKTIINGLDLKLSTEVLNDLDKVHREFPFPI